MKNYVKFILTKLHFQNVLVFNDPFADIITPVISSTQIACGVIYVQHTIQ